jgi:hypothetical protein
MTTATVIPFAFSAHRRRLLSADVIRQRALDRLYQRRAAIDELIRALEDYQRIREVRIAATSMPLIALEK